MLRWLGMGFLKHQQYVTSSFRECNKKDRGGFGIQGKSSWLPKGSLKLKLIFSGESFHCWNPQIILKKPPFLGFMIHVSFLGCIFYSDAVFFFESAPFNQLRVLNETLQQKRETYLFGQQICWFDIRSLLTSSPRHFWVQNSTYADAEDSVGFSKVSKVEVYVHIPRLSGFKPPTSIPRWWQLVFFVI